MSMLGEGAVKSLSTDVKMKRTDFDELNGDEICPQKHINEMKKIKKKINVFINIKTNKSSDFNNKNDENLTNV